MNKDGLAEAGGAGAWHAVVIGVDGYLKVTPELRGAVGDAMAFKNFLVTRVQVAAENVHLLVTPHEQMLDSAAAPSVDAAAIRAAFADVKVAVGKGDRVVLYYAGPGVCVWKEGDRKWMFGLAPSDFATNALDRMITSLEITHFIEALAGQGAHVTAFFDCCQSGVATRDADPSQHARGIAGEVTAEASAALNSPASPSQIGSGLLERAAGRGDFAATRSAPGGWSCRRAVPTRWPGRASTTTITREARSRGGCYMRSKTYRRPRRWPSFDGWICAPRWLRRCSPREVSRYRR